jgi:uncharacterized C2H2 Zn-finger protein
MKQIRTYKIDLTKIDEDGDGAFRCPKCGTMISPDDETEEVYSLLEQKINQHDLEELLIRCNRCSSHIHLTGFSLLSILQRLSLIEEREREKEEKEEHRWYVTHI